MSLETEIKEFQTTVREFRNRFEQKSARDNARIDALETVLGRPPMGGGVVSYGADSEEMKALGKFLRKGKGGLGPDEFKALSVGTDATAGFLAPPSYAGDVIHGIVEWSPVRQIAKVIQIDRESIKIPRRTASGSAAWTTELGTRTETVGLSYGQETLTPHECYYLAKVSEQLLEDNAYNLEQELSLEFSERFGKLTGAAYINGTGVGQPEGLYTKVVDGTIAHIHSGSASAITAAGIMAMPFQISVQYWPKARFLLSRASLFAIRTLVDPVSGLYLFAPAMDKTPDRIAGFPYTLCEDLEGPDTDHYPVLFGDFTKGYLIADRIQLQVQRISEKYIEDGEVGFRARMRTDGKVVLAEAIVALQCHTE